MHMFSEFLKFTWLTNTYVLNKIFYFNKYHFLNCKKTKALRLPFPRKKQPPVKAQKK